MAYRYRRRRRVSGYRRPMVRRRRRSIRRRVMRPGRIGYRL